MESILASGNWGHGFKKTSQKIGIDKNQDWGLTVFKTPILREILRTRNLHRVEHCAFSEVEHLFLLVGCVRNKLEFVETVTCKSFVTFRYRYGRLIEQSSSLFPSGKLKFNSFFQEGELICSPTSFGCTLNHLTGRAPHFFLVRTPQRIILHSSNVGTAHFGSRWNEARVIHSVSHPSRSLMSLPSVPCRPFPRFFVLVLLHSHQDPQRLTTIHCKKVGATAQARPLAGVSLAEWLSQPQT